MTPPPPLVSVFIPTFNGLTDLKRTLAAIFSQKCDFAFEVVCVDSSSRDGTWELLGQYPIARTRIPQCEFRHGGTRNLGVSLCKGEIVVLLSQDATPADETWLAALADNYADPTVAAVYSRQLPRPDGTLLPKIDANLMLSGLPERRVQRRSDHPTYADLSPDQQRALCNFDDICASMRRSVWDALPYRDIPFAEDLDWGKRAFEAGHTIVYEPRSRVVHSHDRSFLYEFKRSFLTYHILQEMFGRKADGFGFRQVWRTFINAPKNLLGVYPAYAEEPLADRLRALYIIMARATGHAIFNVWARRWGGTPLGDAIFARLSKGV